jgi:hypothetical protein
LSITVHTEADLQRLLSLNRAYANGKNVRVTHLYATAAQSRFPAENIFGIYLTRPAYVWMAVWMAVTDRLRLQKRRLQYVTPKGDDHIGTLLIGGITQNTHPREWLRTEAYLYLFGPVRLPQETLEFSDQEEPVLFAALARRGYRWQNIERKGSVRRALVPPPGDPQMIIGIDRWQVAVVNVPTLVPTIEIILTESVIDALAKRVIPQRDIVGKEYLL